MKTSRASGEGIKSKPLSNTVAAAQDVVGLLTTLVQKLTSFETKIDTVLSRIPAQPAAIPRPQQAPHPSPERHKQSRPMYKVICADCGKDCEVPFRPSSERPVYCKECFKVRRNSGTFNPRGDNRAKEVLPPPSIPAETPKAEKHARPVKKKKPAATKKKSKK
ncbi:MAG: hypothetical protein JW800_05615 [Candidatus Omnitrophica bacterium]|nr:hypothetical protein [Candidatus Omnitrophota bacterium]